MRNASQLTLNFEDFLSEVNHITLGIYLVNWNSHFVLAKVFDQFFQSIYCSSQVRISVIKYKLLFSNTFEHSFYNKLLTKFARNDTRFSSFVLDA